jgi:putative cardiolipin synthase
MNKYVRYVRQFAFASMAIIVAGCASIDYDFPREESYAIEDTQDTYLGKQLADDVAAHPGESGFYPILEGIDSLALRLLMAERAEKTIDAQYFLIYNDIVGKAFANALIKAANRGVRVRFLLDDILSKGLDPGLAALNSHPNIEVRIFNPLNHRSARALNIGQYDRMTRRMHNKSFTVDNQITLVGGRNIAGEYYDARDDEKFLDIDVLGIGSVVSDVSTMFDTYWNFRAAVPMEAIAEAPENAAEIVAGLDATVKEMLKDEKAGIYADAVKANILKYVETKTEVFSWSDYDLVYDMPDKSSKKTFNEDDLITKKMAESLGSIDEELFISTPYFVLTKEDIEWFGNLRARGVEVTVFTNSLASNNHTTVHSKYGPTRKALLEMGIKLYEQRAAMDRPVDEKVEKGDVLSTLHAKAFAVDRRSLFIGSFNWNQRSLNQDTESGVIIHSPDLATRFVEGLSAVMPETSFEVSLDESNNLLWTTVEDGQEITVSKEPQTGAWKRFTAWFLRIAPRSQM